MNEHSCPEPQGLGSMKLRLGLGAIQNALPPFSPRQLMAHRNATDDNRSPTKNDFRRGELPLHARSWYTTYSHISILLACWKSAGCLSLRAPHVVYVDDSGSERWRSTRLLNLPPSSGSKIIASCPVSNILHTAETFVASSAGSSYPAKLHTTV